MATTMARRNTTFLPPVARSWLRRMALGLAGLLVLCIAFAFAAALYSHDPADPSFNTAGDGPVANLLGRPGAFGSDLLMQSLGLGAWIVVLVIAAWGARLVAGHGAAGFWRRSAMAFLTLLLGAAFLGGMPGSAPGSAAAGLGGLAGVLASGALEGWIGGWSALPLLLAGALAVPALLLAMGLPLAVLPNAFGWSARTLRWAGSAVAMAATRVTVTRTAPEAAPAAPKPRRAPRDRQEPHLDGVEVAVAPAVAVPAPVIDLAPPGPEIALRGLDEDDEPVAVRPPPPAAVKPAKPVVAPRAPRPEPSRREMEARQGSLLPQVDDGFILPPLELLAPPKAVTPGSTQDPEALAQNARLLAGVLADYGVKGNIVHVRPGPVVTLYELEPAPGTKSSRVIGLANDIARSMSKVSARVADVPGRNAIGIELPNSSRETVFLRELLAAKSFEENQARLVLALGKTIGGEPVYADLAKMPHLLVAGATGSGKSVAINTMILSLLYRLRPEECRFIMIDPKMLELSVYDGIPHLLSPVVTEPRKAVVALKWAVREMENRYRAMSQLQVRNILGFNQKIIEETRAGRKMTRTVQTGYDPQTGKPIFEEQDLDLKPLPYIVVVVDEMADLMMTAGKDVEGAVQRLAQMARAAGIHLIMATQRPSVDVITGTIKANFPTRISFQVSAKVDSRTILGEQGAEQLLGQGDMLYMAAGGRITRVHGPFATDQEVERVVDHLRGQGEPVYEEAVTEDEEEDDDSGAGGFGGGAESGSSDPLFDQAVALIAQHRKVSTSFIQRHLQIGYNRAARIVERMEQEGMVGQANHVGKREILLPAPR